MFFAENPDGPCPGVRDLVAKGYLDPDKLLFDAWDRPFVIRCDDTRVTVTSAGNDGQFQTSDDISYPSN